MQNSYHYFKQNLAIFYLIAKKNCIFFLQQSIWVNLTSVTHVGLYSKIGMPWPYIETKSIWASDLSVIFVEKNYLMQNSWKDTNVDSIMNKKNGICNSYRNAYFQSHFSVLKIGQTFQKKKSNFGALTLFLPNLVTWRVINFLTW